MKNPITQKEIGRNTIIISSLLITAGVAYLDFITGYEINFSIFYLIPVAIVVWNLGRKAGIYISVICTVLWTVAEGYSEHIYSHHSILYWNAAVIMLFFIIVAMLLFWIKKLIQKERNVSQLNSEMISTISHEFNNLLTGIHLSSELLRDQEEAKGLDKERANLYSILDQNYTQMMQDVRVFLNKSRLESGKLKLNLDKVKIRDIIDNTLEILKPLTFEKNIKIIKEFPDETILVKCDPDAISLVLSNLISNAIKYSNRDGIIIAKIEKYDEKTVKIFIEDSGIGIGKEDIDKIFSGFYRTIDGMKQAKGFGIGLKVSRDLIELHSSSLEVESEKGKGSKFYFTLPLYIEE